MSVVGTRSLVAAVSALLLAASAEAQVVTQLSLPTNDLIYDPGTQKIYASVPSTGGPIANTITIIDPFTGTVGASVFVGSEPNRLAISDDGQFLYVGLDGASAVRRVALSTLTPGLQIPLGNDPVFGPRFAEDIAVLPGSPLSIAVSRRRLASPRHSGVAIYDDAVQRPTETAVHTGSNVIEFSSSSARLYGYNNETTEFGFRRMSVDASGVAVLDATPNLISQFNADIRFADGLIYSTAGQVVDPEPRTLAGTFVLGFGVTSVVPDVALGRVFFLQGQNILAFNRLTFLPLGTFQVAAASGNTGSLIRWGADGLAFRTSAGQVFLVQGSIDSPDLVETAVTNPPPSATAGVSFTVSDTVQNQSAGSSAASTTRYYLSLNPVKDFADPLLGGTRAVPSLAPGNSSSGSAVVTIPGFTVGGAYFLLACADDLQAIIEVNETNNCAASAAQIVVEALDPLIGSQWHLATRSVEAAGANVIPVWQSVRGSGVVIGIVDDGLQYTHPDLHPNYMPALSFDFNNNDPDPSPFTGGDCNISDCHGTAVAGVAAARGGNGIGGSGAAPLASLAGLRLISAPITDAQIAEALAHQPQDIHVLNNSWGPSDDGATVLGPGPLTEAAIQAAAIQGRAGRGRIFLWAAGNGAQNLDNCNFDGFATTRFAIAVGALADTGQQAFYSEPCAAMFVTAPSSGGTRAITTTDLVGSDGYSFPFFNDYTNTFGGTSSAAPLVSGIVALMLQANPSLTWRDVQHILARSSHRVNPGDPGWSAGRYPHNEKFGFGLVDAEAAVNLARLWRPVLPERAILPATRTLNVAIPDNTPAGPADAITLDGSFANFRVEHVEVEFTATHTFRGDLEVTLISPSGVVSRLATVREDPNANLLGWRFRSVRHWGERAEGTWTLRVSDRVGLDVGVWHSWTLRLYGTQPTAPPGIRPVADFDGDGRADFAIYRPSSGTWVVQNEPPKSWGVPSDIPVPGDYDGDRRADIAVYRPSTGAWFIDGQSAVAWGAPGDIPVPSDYNGDGRTDIAVFRPSTGIWFVRNLFSIAWGQVGDIPVPGDYTGDGAAEVAIYRPAGELGFWYIQGFPDAPVFGAQSDIPVPADYNGDGRVDIAVYRPSTGGWFVRNQFSAQWGTFGDIPLGLDVNGDGRAELVIYRRSQGLWFSADPVTGLTDSTQQGGPGDLPALAGRFWMGTRAGDMEGDGLADPTVFRPSTGVWYALNSSTRFASHLAQTFGMSGDHPVPGDYLGIGRNQPAGYRSSDGTWRVAAGPIVLLGSPGDLPVPADYDGDGRTDIAVYRPSTGTWDLRLSSTIWVSGGAIVWGAPGDIPVPGDFDGDRRADLAVFRPSTGVWYVLLSSGNFSTHFALQWGVSSDVPAPADFDGDQRTDIALWRPSSGIWYVLLSSRNFSSELHIAAQLGIGGDTPVAADFDGDGRADFAVFEQTGTWKVLGNVLGLYPVSWGTTGDVPVLKRP